MRRILLQISLLKGYFQMYWLKPFDAINDTANAMALLQFNWSERPILEIGGGDGVFSFIMHGGKFSFMNDRYDQIDISRPDDIYDVYRDGLALKVIRKPSVQYDAGIDLKLSHLFKSKETGLYLNNNLISAKPEKLPIKDNAFSTIFLYTFHGLTNYKACLSEIARIIKKDGQLFLIVVNDIVKNNFICHKIQEYCADRKWNLLSKYFSRFDNGRYQEIGIVFSKNFSEWRTLFKETGFRIEEVYGQVSPLVWRIYDTQTRPILKALIRINRLLKKFHLKPLVKLVWICLWLPVLIIFYFIFARPVSFSNGQNHKSIFLCIKVKLD